MKFTALLPIKSESQRVPNKNFKLLNNKALFKWILEKLISINEIEAVITLKTNPLEENFFGMIGREANEI